MDKNIGLQDEREVRICADPRQRLLFKTSFFDKRSELFYRWIWARSVF